MQSTALLFLQSTQFACVISLLGASGSTVPTPSVSCALQEHGFFQIIQGQGHKDAYSGLLLSFLGSV